MGEKPGINPNEQLLDNLYDLPGEMPVIPVVEHPLFVQKRISPYYQERVFNGVKLIGYDLIQAGRLKADSYYYQLSEEDRRIIDSRFPISEDQVPLKYREITEAFGVKRSYVNDLLKRVRANLIGEIKLD